MPKIMASISELPILRDEIYQSNPLIEARKSFDLMETRVFYLGLQGLNPHFSSRDKYFDEEFKELFIPASQLSSLFGNTKYLSEIKKACTRLREATIEVKNSASESILVHLFRRIEYVANTGLYIHFDDVLRPYILDLSEARRGYTRINAAQIFRLASPYAIRLLELLLQYQNIKEFRLRQEVTREIKMLDLRFFLNVPESAYKGRLGNFRKFVLDGPIREINRCTFYSVKYQTVKVGRKVVGFEFKLDMRRVPISPSDRRHPHFSNEAIDALRALGFSAKAARDIFARCFNASDCFSRINRAQAILNRSKTQIRNRSGFLRRAIEGDWQVQGKLHKTKKPDPLAGFASVNDIFKTVLKSLRKQPPPVEDMREHEVQAPPKKNKYGLPENLVQNLREWIETGQGPETVQMVLDEYKLTLEQFRKEFM